jgi:hypothetical protein
LDEVPSVQVTMGALLVVALMPLGAAGALAAAGAMAAGAAVEPPADLLMPPWPLQAPRPPLDEVPSVQVTVPPLLLVLAGAAAGAGAGAGAGAAAVAAPEADLLMPPCPLQAPRPPCGEVLPSLQVTGLPVSCAEAMRGSASTVAASTAPHIEALEVITFMAGSPCKRSTNLRSVRIPQSPQAGVPPAVRAPAAARAEASGVG